MEAKSNSQMIVMVGLPRSGKSTWVEKHREGKVVVSGDRFRHLVYNQRWWSEGELLMRAIESVALRNLLEQGVDVIVDEVNHTPILRRKLIMLAEDFGYRITAVVTPPAAVEELKRRARETVQMNLLPVIDRMATEFVFPKVEEGFDRVLTVEESDREEFVVEKKALTPLLPVWPSGSVDAAAVAKEQLWTITCPVCQNGIGINVFNADDVVIGVDRGKTD